MTEENDLTFRIITLGDSNVGKTSIIKKYLFNSFDDESYATVGIQFSFKVVTLSNNKNIRLKLIDTAGQEKYLSLSQSYFKNADGVLFVFSLDDKKSFEHVNYWIKSFEETRSDINNILIYLVGNKCDLKQVIDQNLIDELAKKIGHKYIATSALNGNNIENLFNEMDENFYKNYKPKSSQSKFKIKNKNKGKSKCNLCSSNDL